MLQLVEAAIEIEIVEDKRFSSDVADLIIVIDYQV